MTIFMIFQSQLEFTHQNNTHSDIHSRSLAESKFENINIDVVKKNQFNDDNISLGNYQCRHTKINSFPSNDLDQANQTSIFNNVLWFMSGNANFLFDDQQMDSSMTTNTADNNSWFAYLNNENPDPRKQVCEFTIAITETDGDTNPACQAKGYQLDNDIDKIAQSKCIQNQDQLDNTKLALNYLSCGTKFISKINGGNTYAKITIGDREWMINNERDFLEDFQYDSVDFTVSIEIPNDQETEGPYSEIGCVVSQKKGFGYVARGPKTLMDPK